MAVEAQAVAPVAVEPTPVAVEARAVAPDAVEQETVAPDTPMGVEPVAFSLNAAVPLLWERVHPNLGAKLMSTMRTHNLIDSCIQPPGQLEALAQHHSKFETDSSNPMETLNISQFTFSGRTRGAEDIKRSEEMAKSGKEEVDAMACSTVDKIQKLGTDVKALELQQIASTLEDERNTACSNVKGAAASLEEIVSSDPQKRKGRDAVLADVYGSDSVEGYDSGKKLSLYKQERTKRIAQRRNTTDDEVKRLCGGNWSVPLTQAVILRQNIRDEMDRAEDLMRQASQAAETQEEVSSIIPELADTLQAVTQLLADCKARRIVVNRDLGKKGKALRTAVEQLLAADLDYRNTYIEHEALRIQTENLSQCCAEITSHASDAELAAQPALEACNQWRVSALEGEQRVRDLVQAEVGECQTLMMMPTQAAALNIQLGERLLTNAVQDADTEKASIKKDMDDKQVQQMKLEAEMVLEEPERNLSEIQDDHAQVMSELKTLEANFEKSESMHQQLQASLGLSATTWKTVKDFYESEHTLKDYFEAQNVEEEVRPEALRLADDLYQDYKLFRPTKQRSSPAPAAITDGPSPASATPGDGVLVTIDPHLKDWIEKMIEQKAEEKAKVLFDQFRADQTLCRAPSAVSSDAEDWTKLDEDQ